MKIKFLGAAGTVTGSSYVLTSSSGQSILIDLGMFQGPPEITKLNYQPFAYDAHQLSAIILTHAHLDHCGRLPILLPKGFTGEVWMTPATRDLTELSLLDSAHITREDKREILYDEEMALNTIARFKTVEYHVPLTIGDFTITLVNAGHILGSATLEIVDNHPSSEIKRVVFSGDLGNSPEPLEQPTELVGSADVVVMESTYGDRLHPALDPVEAIQLEMNTIEKTGGTLLIPAFSLERTQELLHMILHLKEAGKVSAQTPILMDSPMAQKATLIYDSYLKMLNEHIQSDLDATNPFEFPGLRIIQKMPESQAIHHIPGSKVIIAGSGMMVGGRILSHAAYYLPDPSTRLLIVGYQGVGTLGRALMEGVKEVIIDQERVAVRATITDTQAMSSHADQSQLLSWLKNIQQVKKVFLTHGDDIPRTTLAKKITEDLGITDVVLPKMLEEVEF